MLALSGGRRSVPTALLVAAASSRSSQKAPIATLSSREIRDRFVSFFEIDHAHKLVPSSSLVPLAADKSLLFTNAGMVQFKDYFLNPDIAPFKKVVSAQRCLRAGGKHNDLDNVGFTPRHHTLFEMLGNFAFGSMSKRDVIHLAWDFLTNRLGLPKDRLRVTVLNDDDEAYDIWKNDHGIAPHLLVRSGPADNFWSMGDGPGPCGPCSEIYWDTQVGNTDDDGRYLEIWNLVFMQYQRQSDGSMERLATPCIDTGMGLERLASVLQGKKSNFEIDTFVTLMNGINDVQKKRHLPLTDHSSSQMRIVADHIRASTFLVSDGVVPFNTGRGYVLRRIMRRMIKAGRQLGFQDPFLADIAPFVVKAHPENADLASKLESIALLLDQEEKLFSAAFDRGLARLQVHMAPLSAGDALAAESVFELYESFGFPMDLTELMARERGLRVDVEGAIALLERQRVIGRSSWVRDSSVSDGAKQAKDILLEWKTVGAQCRNLITSECREPVPCVVTELQLLPDDNLNDGGGERTAYAIIDPCPFYPGGGGQVCDKGHLLLSKPDSDTKFLVTEAFISHPGCTVVKLSLPANNARSSSIKIGDQVLAFVDHALRARTAAHHTATHLLHAALRATLGKSVVQAGSSVGPDRLRFDFTHSVPVTSQELAAVEERVNAAIDADIPVQSKMMNRPDAVAEGAICLFEEKYGDTVTVIDVEGVSKELCGGTHVARTSALLPFKILSECSVASGIRRIEAVAGAAAVRWLQNQSGLLATLSSHFQTPAAEILPRFIKLADANKTLTKRVEELNKKLIVLSAAGNQGSNSANTSSSGRLSLHIYPFGAEGASRPVDIHRILENQGDNMISSKEKQMMIRTQAVALRDAAPDRDHILLCADGRRAVCSTSKLSISINTETAVDAGTVLRCVMGIAGGGRGGGRGELAEGVLEVDIDAAWQALKQYAEKHKN